MLSTGVDFEFTESFIDEVSAVEHGVALSLIFLVEECASTNSAGNSLASLSYPKLLLSLQIMIEVFDVFFEACRVAPRTISL